jgi:predicted dithiol-disulfide oxidoreductase (DUF899 family)
MTGHKVDTREEWLAQRLELLMAEKVLAGSCQTQSAHERRSG